MFIIAQDNIVFLMSGSFSWCGWWSFRLRLFSIFKSELKSWVLVINCSKFLLLETYKPYSLLSLLYLSQPINSQWYLWFWSSSICRQFWGEPSRSLLSQEILYSRYAEYLSMANHCAKSKPVIKQSNLFSIFRSVLAPSLARRWYWRIKVRAHQ